MDTITVLAGILIITGAAGYLFSLLDRRMEASRPETLPDLIRRLLKDGPMHGYQIAKAIEKEGNKILMNREGALYPTLHRMEENGELLIETRQENGRLRRYYRLVEKGR